MIRRTAWISGAALIAIAQPAPAAAQTSFRVDPISTDRDCSIYESFWGTWLVIECRRQFPEMRDRLGSALTESGRFRLGGASASLIVTGRITALGMTNSRAWASGPENNYCIGGTRIGAGLDLRVRDARSGRTIFAGTIMKTIEVAAHVVVGSSQCAASVPGQVNYGTLQREVALAAARAVAFQTDPLRVTDVQGRRVTLNYGTPLLTLGMIVQVLGPGGYPAKYLVTAATPQSAFAEPMGNAVAVAPGAVASVIENDDPAANGRRYERVDLP